MIDHDPESQDLEVEYLYPQEEEARDLIKKRRSRGTRWRIGFLAATATAVVILTILLINITNQSMGLVVEQTEIPEQQIVTDYNKDLVVAGSNIALSSEDDQVLAEGIAADPDGIGFFGYAFYKENEDDLRLVAVDGLTPSAESVQGGEYPGTRPLLLYTSTTILEENPQVAAFILYYLQRAEEVMVEIGYFPADPEAFERQRQSILSELGLESMPAIDPSKYSGDLHITGSSTVNPVTIEIARRFRRDGFAGEMNIESTGTGDGLANLCEAGNDIHIVNASRLVTQPETEACQSNELALTEFLIGTDALVVVVNKANDFVADVSREELEMLFGDSVFWSDVRSEWPSEEIARYIPTEASGTMDFFVENFFLTQSLAAMPYDALVTNYASSVSAGRCRAVEVEQRFYADSLVCDEKEAYVARCESMNPPAGCTMEPRSHQNVETLIQQDIVKPRVLQSWFLIDSVINRAEIATVAARDYPNAELKFKRWWTVDFITSPQSSQPELAGVRTAVLGSLWVVFIAVLFGFPLGVGAATYLEEYADKSKRFNQIIQTNINNLSGVPSIIYGLLGLAVFVRALEPLTSGCALGFTDCSTANGRTILSAGLTLSLLILPLIIISAQEAIRAVPISLRQASLGLGATKWQTIWHHVLPNAIGGILTGVILAMSRAIGETAPLVVVGASTFITSDPNGPFSKFTTLPSQIYQWTTRPQSTFLNIAAAAIITLLVLLFLLNATAIVLRNRYSKKLSG